MACETRTLNAEHLAHWYLRLNGFLTINDFVLHRDQKDWGQRTDADVVGVRFAFRRELNFEDDVLFENVGKAHLVIAEVTRRDCKLNGPWTTPKDANIQYLLKAIGAFRPERVDEVARSLYENYSYEDDCQRIELIAFGSKESERLATQTPPVRQITFDRVARFIYYRFREYWNTKKDHRQWDKAGKTLWDLAKSQDSEEAYIHNVFVEFGIPVATSD